MAASQNLSLTTGDYVQVPAAAQFLLQNASRNVQMDLEVVCAASKPAASTRGFLLAPGASMTKLSDETHWIFSPNDNCRAHFVVNDLA